MSVDTGSFDAGNSSALAQPEAVFASAVGAGLDRCADTDAGALDLIRQPERFTIFRFVGATECESLDRSSLLRNVGSTPLRILGLAFDRPEFSTPALFSPSVLQPDEALTFVTRFRGDAILTTTLTVATDAGCQRFEVLGVTGADGLFDTSANALDFGAVPVGGSAERSITLQMQFTDPVAHRSQGLDEVGFGTVPEGVFQIVSGPASPLRMRSCEPVELLIRLRAPQAPGPVEGAFGYGIGPGDGYLDLFATAVAR